MSEGQVEKKAALVDPFTGKVTEGCSPVLERVAVDANLRPELGVELDKETGNTKVVESGIHDIQQEIQEFKDQCGFEGMRKLISAGQATPMDFYDDGKHGQDVSGLPDNVNDAFRAAKAANLEKDQMLKRLGVDESDGIDETEKRIQAAVQAYFESLAKKAQAQEVKKDETK